MSLPCILLLTPTNLAAGKLTAFILCSARKKLANLLTFAVLNHSIQVYLSAFKRIREPDIWNWTQFIDCFYLLDQKHDFWPLNLLVFRLTVLSSLIPRTISKRSKDFLITYLTNPDRGKTIRLVTLMICWITICNTWDFVQTYLDRKDRPSWFYQRGLQISLQILNFHDCFTCFLFSRNYFVSSNIFKFDVIKAIFFSQPKWKSAKYSKLTWPTSRC